MGRFQIKGSDDKLQNTHLRGIEEPFFINADLGRQRVKGTPTKSHFYRKFRHDGKPGVWGGNENRTQELHQATAGHSQLCRNPRLLAKNEGIQGQDLPGFMSKNGTESTCDGERVMSQLIQPLIPITLQERLSMSVIQSLAPPANKCPSADSVGDVLNRKATAFPTNTSWSSRSLFKHAHTMVMKNLCGRKFAVFENLLTESRLYSN